MSYYDYQKIKSLSERHSKVHNLINYINVANLSKAHEGQVANKAVGIDKVTKMKYAKNLKENLGNIVRKMKTGGYNPKPVKRVHIPKGNGKTRPLGIPSYEDKLVQNVIGNILTQIYDHKFYNFSYGFRPAKNCHLAIKDLYNSIMNNNVNYVVDADIKGFFNNMSHDHIIKFLCHDISDKKLITIIRKFLRAGVIEKGKFEESLVGSPQGGLFSPIIANVYLHYVLDMWFQKVVIPNSKGYAKIIRYADDFVCLFQYEEDARKFYNRLKIRLAKFNLELAEDKSKIIEFGRFAYWRGHRNSFVFLGFRFFGGLTNNNKHRVHFQSNKDRIKMKKKGIKEFLYKNMHTEDLTLIRAINRILTGHYNYYGIVGNWISILNFYFYVKFRLFKTLKRRSQKSKMTWTNFKQWLNTYKLALPKCSFSVWD